MYVEHQQHCRSDKDPSHYMPFRLAHSEDLPVESLSDYEGRQYAENDVQMAGQHGRERIEPARVGIQHGRENHRVRIDMAEQQCRVEQRGRQHGEGQIERGAAALAEMPEEYRQQDKSEGDETQAVVAVHHRRCRGRYNGEQRPAVAAVDEYAVVLIESRRRESFVHAERRIHLAHDGHIVGGILVLDADAGDYLGRTGRIRPDYIP